MRSNSSHVPPRRVLLRVQGCWFFAITHISFSDDATWRASRGGDTTRLMFVPVLFAWVFLGALCVCVFASVCVCVCRV
jgi:hypothetical protein